MAKKAKQPEIEVKEQYLQEGEKRNRIRVQFDINYEGSNGKTMDQDSDTIPDLNLTVRQLLENHSRGKDSEVEIRQPLYMEFPIPRLQDMTDVHEYQEHVQMQLNNIKKFIAENDLDENGNPIEREEKQVENDEKKSPQKAD